MRVTERADSLAGLRIGEAGLDATQQHGWVHHGDVDEAVRTAEAAEFGKEGIHVRNVIENEAAEDAVKCGVWQRERLNEVVLDKVDGFRAGFRAGALE